jgi:hypothetical protein
MYIGMSLPTVSPRPRGTSEYAGRVIPTLLLVGLVFGRWWRVVIPAAAIGWAVLLVVAGVDSGPSFAVAAALLGAINVAVGAVVFQAARLPFRNLLSHRQDARSQGR